MKGLFKCKENGWQAGTGTKVQFRRELTGISAIQTNSRGIRAHDITSINWSNA